MAYKVLYRKYRPQTFSDLVGQESITQTLKNELIAGRIAHAYLFTGSRGTGKTSSAKILAKAVNCLDLQNGDPCGKCENCMAIDNGSMMDVMEIDAASNNKVGDVRSLIEEVEFTPVKAKYRVYIIDEVHELSSAAFNALLKTLEEPPAHAVFILATTEVHRLLATILSRCQRFDFRRITAEDIAGRLEYICSMENSSINHEAALMIARIADGGMRDAISILDQCMGRSSHIDLEVVEETAGIVGNNHLFVLANAMLNRDTATVLETLDKLHQSSKDLSKLCQELITFFRHLMLIKTLNGDTRLIQMPKKEVELLTQQAVKMSLPTILHCLDTFQKTLDKMKFSNQRIELEMAFIKLCLPELDDSTDALLRRIEALEQGAVTVKKAVIEITPKASQEKSVPMAIAQSYTDTTELSKNAEPFKDWQEVVHTIKNYSMTIATDFARSNAYISGDYVLVESSDMVFTYLRTKQEFRKNIRESILAITGKNYKLGPYKKPANEEDSSQANPLDMLALKAKEAGIEVKNID